jgi:hypothetical protein
LDCPSSILVGRVLDKEIQPELWIPLTGTSCEILETSTWPKSHLSFDLLLNNWSPHAFCDLLSIWSPHKNVIQ